jgi:hypothetical protein
LEPERCPFINQGLVRNDGGPLKEIKIPKFDFQLASDIRNALEVQLHPESELAELI